MFNDMFKKMGEGFSRTGCDRNPSPRGRRVDRRYSIGLGLEGLEGRLAPSGGMIGFTVTNGDMTNQVGTGSGSGGSTGDQYGAITLVPTTSGNTSA